MSDIGYDTRPARWYNWVGLGIIAVVILSVLGNGAYVLGKLGGSDGLRIDPHPQTVCQKVQAGDNSTITTSDGHTYRIAAAVRHGIKGSLSATEAAKEFQVGKAYLMATKVDTREAVKTRSLNALTVWYLGVPNFPLLADPCVDIGSP